MWLLFLYKASWEVEGKASRDWEGVHVLEVNIENLGFHNKRSLNLLRCARASVEVNKIKKPPPQLYGPGFNSDIIARASSFNGPKKQIIFI